jgi:zinc protease
MPSRSLRFSFTLILVTMSTAVSVWAAPDVPAEPSDSTLPLLACEQYQLKNGLTVILSPDSSLPIVATEMVYLVGSGHEVAGKTGFAHLFEHLMFQGSKHYDKEYFTPFEPIGASVNGTTNTDRTNYYEHVPSEYAELTLWLESDRMRSLLPVLTQQKLDNQRDVVKNERRQRYEMTPYGMGHWYLLEALYPESHPYHHDTIGSHEDLTRASLDDVQKFFQQYYVPANAALVMAGDFDVEATKSWIEKYFGDMNPGRRAATPVAPKARPGRIHWVVEDAVQLPRIYLAFETPALLSPDDAELDLLASILAPGADGKASRLYQALVDGRKLAKEISAYQLSRRLGGMFVIEATAAPGIGLDELGPALEEELSKALATLPGDAELERVRSGFKKGFFHRIESVGDRASLLGSYFLQTGKANMIDSDYRRYQKASPESVYRAGQRYLAGPNRVRLDFIPGERGKKPRILSDGQPLPVTEGAKK